MLDNPVGSEVEPGIYDISSRMQAGRLKIASHLHELWDELSKYHPRRAALNRLCLVPTLGTRLHLFRWSIDCFESSRRHHGALHVIENSVALRPIAASAPR